MGANTKLTFALALVECDLKKYFPSNQFCIDPVDMIPLNVFQPPRIAISYFFLNLMEWVQEDYVNYAATFNDWCSCLDNGSDTAE